MEMFPVEQTYYYILDNWQSQTLDGKRVMCNQLEHLTVLEKDAYKATMLEGEIRELDESIRRDIDQEIAWGYGRH